MSHPLRVLAAASKTTKDRLVKLGNFSPVTLYAYVSARDAQQALSKGNESRLVKRSSKPLFKAGIIPSLKSLKSVFKGIQVSIVMTHPFLRMANGNRSRSLTLLAGELR